MMADLLVTVGLVAQIQGFLGTSVEVPMGVLLLLFLLIVLPTGDVLDLARAGTAALKSRMSAQSDSGSHAPPRDGEGGE